jgi:hypothetical protein
MSVLDPRLLPLLGTLANTGMDWLAFEIVEMVRRGHEPLEAEGILKAAREKARSHVDSELVTLDIPVVAEPILGDEQIDWAADYVAARLDGALADLDEGYAFLNAIAEGSRDTFRQDASIRSEAPSGAPLRIALIGQEDEAIDHYSIEIARKGILSLRRALVLWALQAKGQSD